MSIKQKIFDIEERIDKPDMSLFWREGQYYREEISPQVKQDALTAFQADLRWVQDSTTTLPAQGPYDLPKNLRAIASRFGSRFLDEIIATQGAGLILICEDQILRMFARSFIGVRSTWLQPVLMRAVEMGHMTTAEYMHAVIGFINCGFQFISVDSLILIHSVRGALTIERPKEFLSLANRLGGPTADIESHIGVALKTIQSTWHDTSLNPTLRRAIVGTLLESLSRGRSPEQISSIIRAFGRFGLNILRDQSFVRYLDDWLFGHFIQLPRPAAL